MNYLINENDKKPQKTGTTGLTWFFVFEMMIAAIGWFAGVMWTTDPLITLLPILAISFLTLILWEGSKR